MTTDLVDETQRSGKEPRSLAKRLLTLQICMLAGLSGIFLIPKVADTQPVGIELNLPEFIGEWEGADIAVSEHEKQVLGPGTEFARKAYSNLRGDRLFASIVLSGEDMNTSIHRPERCLQAQGWTLGGEHEVAIPVDQPVHGIVPVMRLENTRMQRDEAGRTIKIDGLNYYWFVGYTDLTASHLTRTFLDMRDRVFHGYNQRWAYVTVAGVITQGHVRFGRSEKELDGIIQDFIRQLAPAIQKSSVKYD